MTTKDTPPATQNRRDTFVNLMALGQLSATQAWIQAGYAPKSARVEASKALAKPIIRDAIALKRQQLADDGTLPSADQITRELWKIGSDPNGDPSPRVSALRTLADIHGQLGGGKTELPDGVAAFLGALAGTQSQTRIVVEPESHGELPPSAEE